MGHSNQHVFFFPFSCHLCQACGCGLIIEEPQAEITLISSFSFYYVPVWCLIIHPAPVLSVPELPLSTSCQSEKTISICVEVGMAWLRETAKRERATKEGRRRVSYGTWQQASHCFTWLCSLGSLSGLTHWAGSAACRHLVLKGSSNTAQLTLL